MSSSVSLSCSYNAIQAFSLASSIAMSAAHRSSCLSWGSVQGVSWGLFLSKLVIFIFRYSPTLHIRDFHVRSCRTPPFYWELTVSVCIMTMSFLFFHLLFFSSCILLAYLLIFPLYPCVHPYVLHHPSPYVWRALHLEGHLYLEDHICLEGSSLV
jgi:hypothetical protein